MSTDNNIGCSRTTGRYDLATTHHRPNTDPDKPDDTRFCDRLYDVEIRKIICSTNAIESLNAPSRGPGSRPLPQRPGRAEVSLPGHPIAGPRPRQGTDGP